MVSLNLINIGPGNGLILDSKDHRSISIRYRSDPFALDLYFIAIDPVIFVIGDARTNDDLIIVNGVVQNSPKHGFPWNALSFDS